MSKNIITGQMNRADMACGSRRTLFNRRKGQSMVEFALILPVMVLIIAGIFDLGRAFFAYITITNAAREGARYGTLHPKYYDPLYCSTVDSGSCLCNTYRCIVDATKSETVDSLINLTPSNSVITVTCPDTATDWICDSGEPIRVKIDYTYDDMIFKFFLPSGIQMHKYVEMMVP